jgi:hypothetical protein
MVELLIGTLLKDEGLGNKPLLSAYTKRYADPMQTLEEYSKELDAFYSTLTDKINNSIFESGQESLAEVYLQYLLHKYNYDMLLAMIMHYVITNYHKSYLVEGMLRILSHIKYMGQHSISKSIAVIGLTYDNHEVNEAALRCCENWDRVELVPVLAGLHYLPIYLENYRIQILDSIMTKKDDDSKGK